MSQDSRITIVTDLGFGDAGKGSAVDYLVRTQHARLIVRYSGAHQAGHNTVTDDGRHHTFHQFGSGSFVDGVHTHLASTMMVSPLHLWEEADELAAKGVPDPLGQITIDERALIITPYHQATNRIREALRGDGRHGTCGYGVGEAMSDSIEHPDEAIRAGELRWPQHLARKLEATRQRKLDEFANRRTEIIKAGRARDLETLEDCELSQEVIDFYRVFSLMVAIISGDALAGLLASHEHTVFEGAQGVLLDEWYGFHPYTTWSTTTNANADRLIAEAGFDGEVTKLGVLRAYATRHGAGPFPSEHPLLSTALADANNPHNPWQEGFRVGHFDQVLARYALDVVGHIDGLVISCLDQLVGLTNWSVCEGYCHDSTEFDHIIPSSHPDLAYQEKLTQELLESQPILRRIVDGPVTDRHIPGYLARIESMLGVPIRITSTGPRASDKRLHT